MSTKTMVKMDITMRKSVEKVLTSFKKTNKPKTDIIALINQQELDLLNPDISVDQKNIISSELIKNLQKLNKLSLKDCKKIIKKIHNFFYILKFCFGFSLFPPATSFELRLLQIFFSRHHIWLKTHTSI